MSSTTKNNSPSTTTKKRVARKNTRGRTAVSKRTGKRRGVKRASRKQIAPVPVYTIQGTSTIAGVLANSQDPKLLFDMCAFALNGSDSYEVDWESTRVDGKTRRITRTSLLLEKREGAIEIDISKYGEIDATEKKELAKIAKIIGGECESTDARLTLRATLPIPVPSGEIDAEFDAK